MPEIGRPRLNQRFWMVLIMFDYLQIGATILWVLGLAILLALWSYSYYEASLDHRSVIRQMAAPRNTLTLNLGLFLFILGLAISDARWWVRLMWIALGLVIVAGRIIKRQTSRQD